MNLFCKRCDFNLIDASAYHLTKLEYGKSTGMTIDDVHRDIKEDRKRDINESRKSKVDYGKETVLKRLLDENERNVRNHSYMNKDALGKLEEKKANQALLKEVYRFQKK